MRNIAQAEHVSDAESFRELLLELGRRRPFRDPMAEGPEQSFTPAQFHTLIWLGHDKRLTMGELARRLCVTEKTMTGVIDRLTREDCVRRERDETDRRVVYAKLTRKGEQVFRRLDGHFCDRLARFLGVLDVSDRRDLFRIFRKVLNRITARQGTT